MYLSLQATVTNWLLGTLSSLAFRSLQFSSIASANKCLFPILPNSTKISLDAQNGRGKCLGYQPLKDMEMEMYELRKTTKKCVDDYGYNNL